MIIDQMTLRVKNIIFFKTVCIFFGYLIISYSINESSDEYVTMHVQNIKATQMQSEAQERLEAFNNRNSDIADAVSKYHALQTQAKRTSECFDKMSYQKTIMNIDKKFKLSDATEIFVSSSSSTSKNQPKQSLLLKTTAVKVSYYLDDFVDTINFAKEAYRSLPPYSVVRSFTAIMRESITPDISKWMEASNTINLISAELAMEVREIDLNVAK